MSSAHLFSPTALERLVLETLHPPQAAPVAIVGTIDKDGAQVVAGATGNNVAAAKVLHQW